MGKLCDGGALLLPSVRCGADAILQAVRTTGCTVDTLTLSIEQKVLAEARIAAAGLSDSITVHLLDYRSLPASFTHAFDRVVSIEMIEAVGKEFLNTYFETVDRVLKVDRGLAVVQVITMPEARFESYGKCAFSSFLSLNNTLTTFSRSVDFIQKHIFPGQSTLSAAPPHRAEA